jgi:hypothetical protein
VVQDGDGRDRVKRGRRKWGWLGDVPLHEATAREAGRQPLDGKARQVTSGDRGLKLEPLRGTALAVVLSLALDSFAAFWLAVYLLVIAEVVGIIEALSLFRGVTSRNVLLAQVALFAFAAAALILRRRRLVWPRVPLVSLHRLIVDEPLLAVLLVVVGTAIAYEPALAVLTPPNNWDSMSYHLARGSVVPPPRRCLRGRTYKRQNAYQPNAEILVLYHG